ncbi:hypothetical protein WICMUC_004403 [Wickerhamomyces mucosus]|uniref:Uncharacterized protein n=1 Tax=Wickerhamomyces mucosus TaxID=1378264 RepID=A0A9P8TAA0_9ASCO|nr:hypothetical protein WICMUC_004403 [Wickerhamomyces mucosus]
MGLLSKTLFTSSILGTVGTFYFITKNYYIYIDDYLEIPPPYINSQHSLINNLKHKFGIDTGDDIKLSNSIKWANPNNNESSFDYFEKKLNFKDTKLFLTKFKTNEERLSIIEKKVLLGPTLMFHRFLISNYFQLKNPEFNRISGYSKFESKKLSSFNPNQSNDISPLAFPFWQPFFPPGLKSLPTNENLNYVWNSKDILKYENSPLPASTIIYGMFSVLGHGKRNNGGWYDFSFGGDLIPASMVHRCEYYTIKDEKNRDNLVIRLTNVASLIAPNSPKFIDDTNGLHELMTRTMVLDIVRGIQNEIYN